MKKARVVVVGAGIAGLVCAERLAAAGVPVLLVEAAPQVGGRAGGFRDAATGLWLDRGPHLISGAYAQFLAWCARIGAADEIAWQPRLMLAFHGPERAFVLSPGTGPLFWALARAMRRLWGLGAALALPAMRVVSPKEGETTAAWLARIGAPEALVQDFLAPLHLAVMNAPLEAAPAASFRRALVRAFANRQSARLGWWRRPFCIGIARRACAHLARLGCAIRTGARVLALEKTASGVRLHLRHETIQAQAAVLAVSPWARARLLGMSPPRTAPIANLFVWAEAAPLIHPPFACALPSMHWWFDLDALWGLECTPRLFCCVASAEERTPDADTCAEELARLTGGPVRIRRLRAVVEHRATALPQSAPECSLWRIVDAARPPRPDEIPCTLEFAAQRGEEAARRLLTAFS